MFVVLYVLTIFSAYGAPAAISQHRDEDGCERAFKDILAQRAVQKLSLEVSHTCSKTDVYVPGSALADTGIDHPKAGIPPEAIPPREVPGFRTDATEYHRFCEANPLLPNCRGTVRSDPPATNR